MKPQFVAIRARIDRPELAERALAEAYAAEAIGVEERQENGHGTWIVYARPRHAAAVRAALTATVGGEGEVGAIEGVEPVDWETRWRAGIEAVVVSPRLLVRPSFVDHPAAPGQHTLIVDPGQAFGTGHHASTRQALEALDGLGAKLAGARVLDVGTGSGILALAAALLGAGRIVALDVDPAAVAVACANALANGQAGKLELFAGPLDALAPQRFDCVVANLLRREILPLLPQLAGRVARGGVLILTGLLAEEQSELAAGLEAHGLRVRAAETHEDSRGDRWLALISEPSADPSVPSVPSDRASSRQGG